MNKILLLSLVALASCSPTTKIKQKLDAPKPPPMSQEAQTDTQAIELLTDIKH